MEPYFQHTRYASRPQTQPQLQHQPHPHHSFSNNPNMYTPHRSSLHAHPPPPHPPQLHRSQGQPPPQPQPPPLQFQPVLTPAPFNPQNSQFTYNNHHHHHLNNFNANHRPRSDLHNFIQSPRISHQQPLDDDLPHLLPDYNRDNRSDLKDPSRVLPEMWSGRSYIPANIDPDSYRRQLNNRPMSPGFIEEHKPREEIILRGDDNYHRRNQFGSTASDRSSRDFRMVSTQMNHSSPYENLPSGLSYDDGRTDNQRWVHDREVIRDSFIDMGSNEIGDPDANRVGSGKREHYRGREVNPEFERHGSKGSREGSYEFCRTPRKPQQKKSALLRIQKPNYRNREDDRVHYPSYFDDTKSSFRGKDQNLHADRDMGEQVREGSPVELDVSFKSNSLVAKAIVTPGPSSAGVSDSKLAPRNEKVRKVLDLNKDTSNSPLTKPNEGTAKLDSSSVANNTSSSDKNVKQSKEEVTASVIGGVHNRSSLPDSGGAKVLLAKSKTGSSTKGVASNRGETNVVSGKTSSEKVAKKKKIVKRIVKKGLNPNLISSSSQPTKGCSEPVTAASSQPERNVATNSVGIVDSKPCSNETTMMPENDRVEEIVEAIVSEIGRSNDSGLSCQPNIKRKRNDSTSPSGSSCHEETKINENMVNGTSPNYFHSISDTDKDSIKLLNETTSLDVDSVENASKQLCQKRDLSLPENNVGNGSPEVFLSTERNADFCLSRLEKNIIHEFPTSSHNTTLGCVLDNGLFNSPERVKDIDSQTTDVGSKQPSLVDNGIVDKYLSPSFSVGSSKSFWQSNSGEMAFQNAATWASCSSEGVGTVVSSENGPTFPGKINFSSHGTNDDIHKQPSPDMVTESLEDDLEGRSPNSMVSRGCSKEDTPNFKKSKQKVEMPQLDLSKSEVDDMCLEPVNMVNPACWVDTTLRLSFKDATPPEFAISGDDHVNVGLQPCIDGVSAFPQISSTDVTEVNILVSNTTSDGSNGTSPKNTKKRKFSDSQLELTSDVKEGPEMASGLKAPSNSCNDPTQSEAEATMRALDPLCDSNSPSLLREITALPRTRGGYESTAASPKDAIEDDGLRDAHSCLAAEKLAVPKAQSLCLSGLEGKQVADAGIILQNNSIHIQSDEMKKMDVDTEQASVDNATAQCQFPLELQSPNLDERLPRMDVEYDSCHHMKNDLPSVSNYLSSVRDGNGVSTTNSSDEVMGLVPDTLSDTDCLETLPDVQSTSYIQLSLETAVGGEQMLHGKPAIQDGSIISAVTSRTLDTENTLNADHVVEIDHLFSGKTGSLPSHVSRNCTQVLNAISGEINGNGRKNQPTHAVSRIYPGRSSFGLTAKNTASSTHNSKSRTWHRTDNSSASASPGIKAIPSTIPTQRHLPKKITKLQSASYIRKGNSLVRKPTVVTSQSQGSHGSSSSVYRLNSSCTDEVKKNAGSDTKTDVVDQPNFMRKGVIASFERPRTPPLPSAAKMPNHATDSLGDIISSPSAEPLQNFATETASDPMTYAESNDVLKSTEDVIKIKENPMIQTGQINIFDSNNETNNGNVVSSNVNNVTYVKRKSNQLVASSNPCSFSISNAHNSISIPSDGYYKRRKNQLIRTSLESEVKPTVSMPDENVNSEGKTLHSIPSSRSLSKRRLLKVVTKMGKHSKFSFVWTLRSSQLSNDNGDRQNVLPHLFPWKRATYWRNFMPISAANSSNSSSTAIRKLLLLRKRDTVYTRSKHGFSLRKSKVLSVGGSSLKWSKSIEKQSKKANEEATLAVAEAERKKREQSGASHVPSGTEDIKSCLKSVNNIKLHPGEQIFRIGSVRYKMDSSRRTLQRISDDESSNSAAPQTEKDAKRSYVPRRLVIGKDEYVRIGNGNQLIRDPKRRTRILASEKVRWSLHTARSRLARKRKYCQFFTRFGKCNKDDGKCPYIHDSSKIAVCTKFLNGLCFNFDCKLTHKVIPERMPDCSYFLQGLCTNKSCPYRHVHVNPNAPTCEGFLRGYCADGNECRKKHSYVCPTYEATGSCPKGSKCKLHHPKKRSNGKKSKQSREKKKALGRYFGSVNINVSEPGAESEKHLLQDNDNICFEGIADYISLDVSGEAGEKTNQAHEQTSLSDSDPSEFQLVDLDELIKPIRIMNI